MRFSKPNISHIEVAAVAECVEEGHLSDGFVVDAFEDAFRSCYDYGPTIACSSGTAALHTALRCLKEGGLQPGDEVILPAYTFVATANVIIEAGGTPVFADIKRDDYTLDPEKVAEAVTDKTVAVMPVDVFGAPADVLGIREVIPDHVAVIQDCVEAIGTRYNGKPVGSYADVACFGFYPNKQITCAEGGFMVLNTEKYQEHILRAYIQHGKSLAGGFFMPGLNYRMSDVHASIGIVQLARLDEIRHALVKVQSKMDEHFCQYRNQKIARGANVTPFLYVIELPDYVDKTEFIELMLEEGVPVRPYFKNLSSLDHLPHYVLPVTQEVSARTVALPFRYDLTDAEMQQMSEAFVHTLMTISNK